MVDFDPRIRNLIVGKGKKLTTIWRFTIFKFSFLHSLNHQYFHRGKKIRLWSVFSDICTINEQLMRSRKSHKEQILWFFCRYSNSWIFCAVLPYNSAWPILLKLYKKPIILTKRNYKTEARHESLEYFRQGLNRQLSI